MTSSSKTIFQHKKGRRLNANPAEEKQEEKANILLVDDNEENLLALEAILSELQQNLLCANSGAEALKCLLQNEVAVILLDVVMPKMDGFQTAELIRARDKTKHTPIIFLTGIEMRESYVFKGYSLGAVDYILKPFEPEILKSKVSVFVELFKKRDEIKKQAEHLEKINQKLKEAIDQQKAVEVVLQESEKKFRMLVETAQDAIISADERGYVVGWNPAAETIFGYATREILGKPLTLLMPDRFQAAHQQGIARFNATGQGRFIGKTVEISGLRKDGTEFPIELSLSHWSTHKGNFFTAIIRNITERKQAETLLQKAHDELEERVRIRTAELSKVTENLARELAQRKQVELALARQTQELVRSNKELEQFAYAASHDLQEPLRTVTSYIQLLERRYKDRLDSSANDFIHFVVDGVSRMQMLIQDLLCYSQVGTHGKAFAPTDCNAVLEQVMNNLRHMVQESSAQILCHKLPVVPADFVQLVHLFQNLLSNAIKFRNQEPPRIEVLAQEKEEEWLFSVKDNGIGIEPEHQERIFVIFQRLHSKDQYPGTGIGLALCKKIVERHGGTIWVESQLGGGSTFYFTLKKIEKTGE